MLAPTAAFVIGVLLIWVVANGKASAVWRAVTGSSPATTPTNPGNTRPGIPPGDAGSPWIPTG